jgi:hypothetical protein
MVEASAGGGGRGIPNEKSGLFENLLRKALTNSGNYGRHKAR